jgi:hypothetical protein
LSGLPLPVVRSFFTSIKGALTRARPGGQAAADLTREPSRRPTSG